VLFSLMSVHFFSRGRCTFGALCFTGGYCQHCTANSLVTPDKRWGVANEAVGAHTRTAVRTDPLDPQSRAQDMGAVYSHVCSNGPRGALATLAIVMVRRRLRGRAGAANRNCIA